MTLTDPTDESLATDGVYDIDDNNRVYSLQSNDYTEVLLLPNWLNRIVEIRYTVYGGSQWLQRSQGAWTASNSISAFTDTTQLLRNPCRDPLFV